MSKDELKSVFKELLNRNIREKQPSGKEYLIELKGENQGVMGAISEKQHMGTTQDDEKPKKRG